MISVKRLAVVVGLLAGLLVAGVGSAYADSTSWSNCDTPVGSGGGTVPCKSVTFPDLGGH